MSTVHAAGVFHRMVDWRVSISSAATSESTKKLILSMAPSSIHNAVDITLQRWRCAGGDTTVTSSAVWLLSAIQRRRCIDLSNDMLPLHTPQSTALARSVGASVCVCVVCRCSGLCSANDVVNDECALGVRTSRCQSNSIVLKSRTPCTLPAD